MNQDFSTLLRTPLTERLGCRYPIIQTAMGWVSDANLVIATTKAGGFGFLAGATIDANKIEAEIKKVIAELGGMGAFVKKGQSVVVKPNIGWDVPPERAANTHPSIVKRLVEMCFEAGAASVSVFTP